MEKVEKKIGEKIVLANIEKTIWVRVRVSETECKENKEIERRLKGENKEIERRREIEIFHYER